MLLSIPVVCIDKHFGDLTGTYADEPNKKHLVSRTVAGSLLTHVFRVG